MKTEWALEIKFNSKKFKENVESPEAPVNIRNYFDFTTIIKSNLYHV